MLVPGELVIIKFIRVNIYIKKMEFETDFFNRLELVVTLLFIMD